MFFIEIILELFLPQLASKLGGDESYPLRQRMRRASLILLILASAFFIVFNLNFFNEQSIFIKTIPIFIFSFMVTSVFLYFISYSSPKIASTQPKKEKNEHSSIAIFHSHKNFSPTYTITQSFDLNNPIKLEITASPRFIDFLRAFIGHPIVWSAYLWIHQECFLIHLSSATGSTLQHNNKIIMALQGRPIFLDHQKMSILYSISIEDNQKQKYQITVWLKGFFRWSILVSINEKIMNE